MPLTANDTRLPVRADVSSLEEPGDAGDREFLGERVEPLLEAALTAYEHHSHEGRAPYENRQHHPEHKHIHSRTSPDTDMFLHMSNERERSL